MGKGYSKQKKQMKMMQEQLSAMQEEASTKEVTGEAGNGLVAVTINGSHEVKKIKIKPDCVDADDIEGLEDLVKEAFNNANSKLEGEMGQMSPDALGGMGGLGGLGGMGGFPGM